MAVAAEQCTCSQAAATAGRSLRRVRVPLLGEVVIPPLARVAYYTGLGMLAAVGLVEWPVAVVIAIGHVLADQHVFALLRGLGEAAELA